jgi:hypothetical protein
VAKPAERLAAPPLPPALVPVEVDEVRVLEDDLLVTEETWLEMEDTGRRSE